MGLKHWLIALLVTFLFTGNAQADTASEAVKGTVDSVLGYLKDESLDKEQRRGKIRTAIRARFDFDHMGRTILARSWKKASAEQQDRFKELFAQLLENTYIVAIESYSGQDVQIVNEKEVRKGQVQVDTRIVTPNNAIPVNYRLRKKGDEWYAYDVIIEGISLVSNYRGSFRNIIKRQGMDALLDQLAKKVSA